jgi:hypothetical protein
VSSCTNGHPLDAGDAFCAECGAPAAADRTCANGHAMQSGDAFCQECGASAASASSPEPAAAPALATPPVATPPVATQQATEPVHEKRRLSPVMILSGLIVVLAAVLVVLLLTRDRGNSTDTVAFDAAGGTTTTTRGSSTTRAPATTAFVDPRRTFFRDLDLLLVRSSQSRGQLSDALAELNNCVEPAPVASRIREIEVARNEEIDQVGLLEPPDAETQALVETLLDALTNSRDSDGVYYGLVTAMDQCAPIGAGALAAKATDDAATEAKKAFLLAYNPIAGSYGLKSDWQRDQI